MPKGKKAPPPEEPMMTARPDGSPIVSWDPISDERHKELQAEGLIGPDPKCSQCGDEFPARVTADESRPDLCPTCAHGVITPEDRAEVAGEDAGSPYGLDARTMRCDGNHGGPPCADAECWSRDEPDHLTEGEIAGITGRSLLTEDDARRFADGVAAGALDHALPEQALGAAVTGNTEHTTLVAGYQSPLERAQAQPRIAFQPTYGEDLEKMLDDQDKADEQVTIAARELTLKAEAHKAAKKRYDDAVDRLKQLTGEVRELRRKMALSTLQPTLQDVADEPAAPAPSPEAPADPEPAQEAQTEAAEDATDDDPCPPCGRCGHNSALHPRKEDGPEPCTVEGCHCDDYDDAPV